MIEEKFQDKDYMFRKKTQVISGSSEVSVNNVLIHSRNNGDGFVDDDKKRKKIVTTISKLSMRTN